MLIGIAGKKGTGKSTVATGLMMRGFTQVSFTTPIKHMLHQLLYSLGFSPSDIRSIESDKEAVIPVMGVSYRYLCQTLGTEWGRQLINPEVWQLCMRHRLDELRGGRVVIDDVRFENEADFIRKSGGIIIHLKRNSGAKDEHSSEAGIVVMTADKVISNDGPLGSLHDRAVQVVTAHFGYF